MKIKKGQIVIYKGEKCRVIRVAFDIMYNLLPIKYEYLKDHHRLPIIHYGVCLSEILLIE